MWAILDFLRRNKIFVAVVTLAGLALRLFFVLRFPHVAGDTFIYGDIAKTWLHHGVYGFTESGLIRPTLIRLPGYPAFLAGMFSLFGQEHYGAVMIAQAMIDTNACLVIAALALELGGEKAARLAYLVAALCPFTANYAAAPLTETLAFACAAHCLYYGIRGLKDLSAGGENRLLWAVAGLWAAAGILLRPDGALVPAGLGLGLLYCLRKAPQRAVRTRQAVMAGVVLVSVTLAPLLPWAARNWRTFGVFQPLAPRYANDPGEFLPMGFNHWVRTWIADYVSVEEVYWPVSGEPVDIRLLPRRAFDSDEEYKRTAELIRRYNDQLYVGEDLDPEFERLARERVARHPLRYYIGLPTLRVAGMWLRPRTEMLPLDPRWWQYGDHPAESILSGGMAALNLLLLVLAVVGWKHLLPLDACGIALAGFVLVRSAFLGSLENPEPRYMLECFPVILALAGIALARKTNSEGDAPDA